MTEPDDALEAYAPGTTVGHYEVVRLVGRGGMGAVYEARNTRLQKRVALKVLTLGTSRSGPERERFLREGQIASALEHPHIVQVFDYGVEQDVPYLVMELLQGESLAALIGRDGALPVARVVEIMLPVLAAIGVAHDAGIVHRDLKPDNVFLSRQHRGAIVPKVLDFGISKVVSSGAAARLTATNTTMGTAHYMSPAQADGAANVGPEDDQYALGVVLYECATGTVPFDGETFLAVLHAIRSAPVVPPRRLRPELPEAFEQVILRAFDRRPERRFESVRALGRALLPFATPSVRADWEPEFAAHTSGTVRSAPPPDAAGVAAQTWIEPTNVAPAVARPTTLRGSSRSAPSRPASATRRWLAVLGAAALAVTTGVVALLATHRPGTRAIVAAPALAPVIARPATDARDAGGHYASPPPDAAAPSHEGAALPPPPPVIAQNPPARPAAPTRPAVAHHPGARPTEPHAGTTLPAPHRDPPRLHGITIE